MEITGLPGVTCKIVHFTRFHPRGRFFPEFHLGLFLHTGWCPLGDSPGIYPYEPPHILSHMVFLRSVPCGPSSLSFCQQIHPAAILRFTLGEEAPAPACFQQRHPFRLLTHMAAPFVYSATHSSCGFSIIRLYVYPTLRLERHLQTMVLFCFHAFRVQTLFPRSAMCLPH